ncbi:disease resistance protein RUN1 [Trifolium repens]|nr:disease resistance protein RUN1 [Trifolium repens]
MYEIKEYSYEEAMVAHQNRFGKDSENIKAWKAALSEAAGLKGHHIHTGFEIDHIKEIVEKVLAKIAPKPLLVAWEDASEDYERIPRKGIQDVLKVSYDVLEPFAQSVFLDISCFFKGKRIEYVEEIHDEFSAASNNEELFNKYKLSQNGTASEKMNRLRILIV